MDMDSRTPPVSKGDVVWALVALACAALAFVIVANLPTIIEIVALKVLLWARDSFGYTYS